MRKSALATSQRPRPTVLTRVPTGEDPGRTRRGKQAHDPHPNKTYVRFGRSRLSAMHCRYIVDASATDWRRTRSWDSTDSTTSTSTRPGCAASASRPGSRSARGPGGGHGGPAGAARRDADAARRTRRPAQRPRRPCSRCSRAADARLRDDPGAGQPHRRRLAPQPRLDLPHPAAARGRGPDRSEHEPRAAASASPLTDAGRAEADEAAQTPPWSDSPTTPCHSWQDFREAGVGIMNALRQVGCNGTDDQRDRAARGAQRDQAQALRHPRRRPRDDGGVSGMGRIVPVRPIVLVSGR